MKCGVDVMQSQLLDDLRAVYMGDQKLPERKKVIMKVMSVSQGETQRLRGYQEEYTNGVNAPLYDMCISRPSLARFRRKNNDFCRSTRYEENEFKESDQHEMSSMGLGYAANYAALKGVNLAAQGSKVLGSCLRLASPFLARVSSAFVAYDLYKQIQTYNNGNKDALVGVVSDSVVLTIDVASVVVETFEALDLL
uniref:Uncharacterized protein n=1 Tax=Romanomermis culicivorax TaxID=13658 RepID=A0A915J0W1_ROMCU